MSELNRIKNPSEENKQAAEAAARAAEAAVWAEMLTKIINYGLELV